MGTVLAFRLSKKDALRIVRDVAKSGRVGFPTGSRPKTNTWRGLVNFRQVIRCLESGEILSSPKLDEHRHWLFKMSHFCAGEEIFIEVALAKASNGQHEIVVVGYRTE